MTAPLDTEKLLSYAVPETHDDYDPRDAIIYALGVGAGLTSEIDETSLVFERECQAYVDIYLSALSYGLHWLIMMVCQAFRQPLRPCPTKRPSV